MGSPTDVPVPRGASDVSLEHCFDKFLEHSILTMCFKVSGVVEVYPGIEIDLADKSLLRVCTGVGKC